MNYPVLCYRPGCGRPAAYKIASRWSDGVTQELKTYGLSCEGCLAELFRKGREKRAACRLAPGETLEAPAVYELAHGRRDRSLARRTDLEEAEPAEERAGRGVAVRTLKTPGGEKKEGTSGKA